MTDDITRLLKATRSEEAINIEQDIINKWWDAYAKEGLDMPFAREGTVEFARRVYGHAMKGAFAMVRQSPLCKASPDMLGALKAVVEEYDLDFGSTPRRDMAERAIAKAEGESP